MRSLAPVVLLVACNSTVQLGDNPNVAPAAVINAPDDGAAFFTGDVVSFLGTVTDSDGNDDLVSVVWTSTRDGELADLQTAWPDEGGITRVNVLLSAGLHGITLRVVDQAGAIGEATIDAEVGDADQAPSATIDVPEPFTEVLPGDVVALAGAVFDLQQPSDSLDVRWEIGGVTIEAQPLSSGLVQGTWTATEPGSYTVTLAATDLEGHEGRSDAVPIRVADPNDADVDGDGFSVASDCDDADPAVHPGADETCGDLTDHDCNGVVDDKDLDNDGHVDDACAAYPGLLPIDDCTDDDPFVHPDAPEVLDGLDNDCDGAPDEGTSAFDDDGDCRCEVGPCVGSVEPSCVLADGDCDDADAAVHPDVADVPDPGYRDADCDGIDGDAATMVFLDPSGGSDLADGLSSAAAVRTLGTAYTAAVAGGRSWIAISDGTLTFTSVGQTFVEGVHLAGGYTAGTGWSRGLLDLPEITVEAAGKALVGWSTPTEWQQVRIRALSALSPGGSSVALTLDGTAGLALVGCSVESGDAMAGDPGVDGTDGFHGTDGDPGVDGCMSGSGLCPSCSRPPASVGGGACGLFAGGDGGRSGLGGDNGLTGRDGAGPGGGTAGLAGLANGSQGGPGAAGDDGVAGASGNAGAAFGTFGLALDYLPAAGLDGAAGGEASGGGGGGGGAGGGWTVLNCDTWGGAGGAGGGAGCGGGSGTGGLGGGLSAAVVLLNGAGLTLLDSAIRTGDGGAGGAGGLGGAGGDGGTGAPGGAGEASVVGEASGPGGDGGDGGDGGAGGHGGGGGGGPSVGVVCRTGGSLVESGTIYTIGIPGPGGSSAGDPGATGATGDTDGC